MSAESSCEHLSHIHLTKPTTHVCEECVKMGDTWVHLRMCTDRGHVGSATHPRIATPLNTSSTLPIP